MPRFVFSPVILLFLLCFFQDIKAQETAPVKKEAQTELKKATNNLEKALIENDDIKIAQNYEIVAQEFAEKEDYPKAGQYLFKALAIYTSVKDTIAMARVMRKIAQIQELRKQWKAAAQSYKAASAAFTDRTSRILNLNDYYRIKNHGKQTAESKYLKQNIQLLKEANRKHEVADTYIQLAQLSLANSDSVNALAQYRKALPYGTDTFKKGIKIYNEIIKLYISSKNYPEAVLMISDALNKAKQAKDNGTEIILLHQLASVYFQMKDTENAIAALKDSYNVASASGRTFDAGESLVLLADYYKSSGDSTTAMALHEGFIKNLDRIILSDKSLTDAKTFRVTEERIRTLENEKKLRDELISRKNSFNYFLIGSLVVLLLLLAFIAKALHSIKTKNKEIALQSLRLEMNPHFLFNSLNSVNQFIAQNDELSANKYLTSYSNLMRNTMENSNKDFVTLGNEIANLTKYLELEHLRFKDKFSFEIIVDEQLDPETVMIPNMIIQPHLENAIWHGLRYKEEKGLLRLIFSVSGKNLLIKVDDNGIGVTKSNELKTRNQKAHESRGLTNTNERMELLNQLHKMNMNFSVNEKPEPETGTIIIITVPVIKKD